MPANRSFRWDFTGERIRWNSWKWRILKKANITIRTEIDIVVISSIENRHKHKNTKIRSFPVRVSKRRYTMGNVRFQTGKEINVFLTSLNFFEPVDRKHRWSLVGKWEGAHWPLGFCHGRRPRQLAPKLGHLVVCRALATLTEPLTSGNFISRTEIFNYFSFGEYGFYFAFFLNSTLRTFRNRLIWKRQILDDKKTRTSSVSS